MEFLLIRHAEPEWVKDGLSIVNPPLTKRGFDQAERLGSASPKSIWTMSMCRRCLEPDRPQHHCWHARAVRRLLSHS